MDFCDARYGYANSADDIGLVYLLLRPRRVDAYISVRYESTVPYSSPHVWSRNKINSRYNVLEMFSVICIMQMTLKHF